MDINPRQRKWIGVEFNYTRSGGACPPVFLLHHGADRRTPPPVWVSEELNSLPGVLLQFCLAASDLMPCLFGRQAWQSGMGNAVRAERKSLLRECS